MAELVKDLVLVSLGMGIGVVLMCIAQVSKMADEEMEEIKKKGLIKNEFRTELIQLVFKQRPELGAYGNRGNRYLLRDLRESFQNLSASL